MTRGQLAAMIDHTLLAPETTGADVANLSAEGADLGVATVCIPASLVAATPRFVPICAVIGFPSGAHLTDVKSFEATRAIADGAEELDMVINLGAAYAGDWGQVCDDVTAVRRVSEGLTLKVILESATLSIPQLESAARASLDGGADYLKTSTGFHPAGGATVDAVKILAELAKGAGRPVGVKAAGGIRTAEAAIEMIEAGASRLGCSRTGEILSALPA